MITPSLKTVYVIPLALALASCAKHISYRDAYKFDWHTYASKAESKQGGNIVAQIQSEQVPSDRFVATIKNDLSVPAREVQATDPLPPARHKILFADTAKMPVASVKPKPEPNPRKNWAATTGLVFTMVAVLMSLTGEVGLILLLAIPGLILSAIGMKSEKRKEAIVGLTFGAILIVLSFVLTIYYFSLGW